MGCSVCLELGHPKTHLSDKLLPSKNKLEPHLVPGLFRQGSQQDQTSAQAHLGLAC